MAKAQEGVVRLDVWGSYKPLKRQGEIHALRDGVTTALIMGGVGSGKTTGCAHQIVAQALSHPGSRTFCGRRTEDLCREALIPAVFAVVHDLDEHNRKVLGPAGSLIADWLKSEMLLTLAAPQGHVTQIKFGHLQDVLVNFGSRDFSAFWIDEASTDLTLEGFRYFLGRLRHPVQVPAKMLLSTNPADEDHWLHEEFVKTNDPERVVLHLPTMENPYLPAGYIDRLKKMPADWRRKFLEGKWGFLIEGEAVYPEFTPSLESDGKSLPWHLSLDPIPWSYGRPILCGWDFSPVYAGVAWCTVDAAGQLQSLKSRLFTNHGADAIVRKVIALTNEWFPAATRYDYCDPAAWDRSPTDLSSCVDKMGESGLSPMSGAHLWTERRDTMKDLLGRNHGTRPAFCVSKDSENDWVERGFAGRYFYPRTKTGTIIRDGPSKTEHSHPMNALEYLVTGHLTHTASRLPPKRPKKLALTYA